MTVVTGRTSCAAYEQTRVSSARIIALPSGGALHLGGSSCAPPLLLLHGVGGGAWSWRPQWDALCASHLLGVWEARGHGAAAQVADAGLADYYADAREALAAIAGDAQRAAIVVGHSMGGLLAIALACDVPASVAGLFLIDPVYATGDGEYGHFSATTGRIAQVLCAPLLRSFERDGRLSRAMSRWIFERSFVDRARMENAWRDQRTQIPIEYPRMLRESFVGPEGFTPRDFADEVAVPTSILQGGAERPRFPRLVDTLRARLGARFSYESIPGGHYLQLDSPRAVNERLERFAASYAPAVMGRQPA